MPDQIRIGIIGLGIMGKQYARVYAEHALTRVVAVCARRQEQTDEFAAKYHAQAYTDHRKMLERNDLDAVVVATPDAYHFEFARDVLESGLQEVGERACCDGKPRCP